MPLSYVVYTYICICIYVRYMYLYIHINVYVYRFYIHIYIYTLKDIRYNHPYDYSDMVCVVKVSESLPETGASSAQELVLLIRMKPETLFLKEKTPGDLLIKERPMLRPALCKADERGNLVWKGTARQLYCTFCL